jgi:predicted DNA-binding transcriptional regulator YafY
VGSILELEVEADTLAAPPRFDLQRYWKTFTRDFEARVLTGSARVRARPAGLKALAQLNHATAQAVARAGSLGRDGWQTLTIPIESIAHAVADLLRLAPDVQALGPPALRRALREAVARLQAIYEDAPPRRAKP